MIAIVEVASLRSSVLLTICAFFLSSLMRPFFAHSLFLLFPDHQAQLVLEEHPDFADNEELDGELCASSLYPVLVFFI